MQIDVKKCSACGQDHERVQIVELVNPVALLIPPKKARKKWSHYFLCPTNQKQVLVRFTDDKQLADQTNAV